jgi:exosortase/archaeosortase family protein
MSFLALVYAYFFDKKVWMRWALLIGTLPLVILANSGRVTITGILSEFNPELAGGFFHSLEGFVIFAIDFVMLIALHALINRFYRWKFEPRNLVA